MKNSKEKIDLFFKSEIGGFEVAPPPELKENIFIEMAASGMYDNKKRYLLITLLLLFISSIAIVSILFYMGSKDNKTGNTANISISKAELLNKNTGIPSKKINKENYFNPISSSLTQNQKNDESLSKNIKSENKDDKNYNSYKSIVISNPNSEKNTNTAHETIPEKSKNTSNEAFSVPVGSNENKPENLLLMDKIAAIDKIKILPQDQFSIYNVDINSNIVKKVRSKNPFIVSMELYAGHSISQKPILNISRSDNEDNNIYNSKLDFPSGIVGLNVRLEKKHFFGEAGIQISKFSEQITTDKILTNPYGFHTLEISGQNEQVDSTGYYHYFYISDSNIRVIDSVWAWDVDTSFYETYDDVYKTAYDTLMNPSWKNSYTFVDMPLSFGWQMNFGRINLGVKTGPIINMLITTKGSMPIKYNNTIILSDIKEQFKKYQFGLSWQAAATLGYFMTTNLVLECSPYYRFNIIGIKPVNTGAEIKNNSFGLQLGLRYYF